MAHEIHPNFYILGAAKAGTTTLYELLEQHPQVYMPYDKEPAYYCDDEYYAKGEAWYLRTFFGQAAEKPFRGEATSRYLYFGSKVASRIRDAHLGQPAQPRFIVIFREPARLVHSFYWHSVREGKEDLPFGQALLAEPERLARLGPGLEARGQILYAYHRIGNYASQLQHYLDRFPREQFLFLLTEDLQDLPALRQRLCDFFGMDAFPMDVAGLVHANSAALPRSRWLHNFLRGRSAIKDALKPLLPAKLRYAIKDGVLTRNLKAFTPSPLDKADDMSLRAHYRDEVLRLQAMIERDLSAWLGQA